MAARELSRAAYDHETGIKGPTDGTKCYTTYNPWGVGYDTSQISVFAIGDIGKDKILKNLRINLGLLTEGMTREQAADLITGTSFSAVKVMGVNETIRIKPNSNMEALRKITGLKMGVQTALGPVCCPKAYVFPVGKQLDVRFVHVIFTVLPYKAGTHKLGGGILNLQKTKIVGGISVNVQTTGKMGKIDLPLTIPFMEWKKSTEGVFELMGMVMGASLKVALGGVNGLSIHVTAIGQIHKDLKGTGMNKNMMLCPVFMYPDIVFSNCLKMWKVTSAKLILQIQPRVFRPIEEPLVSERDLLTKALKSGGEEED
ncbi:matrix protein [Wenling hoplichthys paramyxovirus]|uniref:Matrix protein n=1 Tax=Wenling hoplichthys paramyxovirus TaxID=2116453 RepID=A0A2P1GN19_9MONO|nr:matrix protein [Wenling hoplichthys paramyxovirus]AVM87397.1 matrix protein [Wenling hoplichthys paramyxovirus]